MDFLMSTRNFVEIYLDYDFERLGNEGEICAVSSTSVSCPEKLSLHIALKMFCRFLTTQLAHILSLVHKARSDIAEDQCVIVLTGLVCRNS